MYSHQRLTLVWKQVQDELKLLHVNCTMARDIPIAVEFHPCSSRLKEDVRWFDYVRRSLNQLLQEIPQLLQVHKNWLINPAHVQTIQRYSVTLLPDKEVPIGKSRYDAVRKALAKREP